MAINRINPFLTAKFFDTTPDTDTVRQVFKTENLTDFPTKKYQWVRREQCFYRQKYQ
jgi:hypothetical protein